MIPLELDTITTGDCLEVLRAMPPESVDLAFADPPFNIGYEYDLYKDKKSDDDYLGSCRAWGTEIVRILKPEGSFWLAIGDEYAAELKVLFHRELGLRFRSWVVWYYTFGVNCTAKFTRSHTHLLYFTRSDQFHFDVDAIKVPSARQLVYADKRAKPGGRLPDDTWILRPQDVPDGFPPEGDTWNVSRVCGTFGERRGHHKCQMPERVLARIIRACSRP
ncbi:DNA-methyltransferase, partial [Singulisphaera rosea]